MSPLAMAQPRSPWHSPVPYLFGGLAAILGLIAFALLILACSYWRLSGRLDNNSGGAADDERDVESGGAADDERNVESGENEGDSNKQVEVYEEKILVIMAGEQIPTFVANPVFTKASSFGDKNGKFEDEVGSEKVKEEMGDDHQQVPIITENSDNHKRQ